MNKSTAPEIITCPRQNFLHKHMILIFLTIHAFLCSLLMFIALLPTMAVFLDGGPVYEDGWVDYVNVFKGLLRGQNVDFQGFISTFTYASTPLFPILLGLLDLLFNNINVSMILLNCFFSITTIILIKKIIELVYGYQENQSLMTLGLYLVNVVVCLDFVAAAPTDPLVNCCITLAFYFNIKYVKDGNHRNGFYAFITNTIILFSREIAWPFLLFGPALYLFSNVIKHYRTSDVKPVKFLQNLLESINFCIFLPVLIFILFIVSLGLFPMIEAAYTIFFRFRTLDQTVINMFFAFSFMPILILLDIKAIVKRKENLPFILWICMFTAVLIVVQTPLWMHYWWPVIFCYCILSYFPLAKIQSKKRRNIFLAIFVVVNLAVTYTYVILPFFVSTDPDEYYRYVMMYFFIM